jgi:hypothetical protein
MATTGTTTSTSDFGGLNDAMKNVYEKAFDNNIEKEQEVLDVFRKASFDTFDGPDGKGVYMNHIFTSGGGFASGTEDDYLPTPTLPVQKQSYLTIKKHTLVSELSGQALRRVLKGPAAFATWADEELPRKAQIGAWHLDRQALGTGTGIVARVNDGSPDTTTTIDSAFGIAGLEGFTRLIREGDSLRYSPNANGTSPRTGAAIVSAIDHDTGIITIDASPASAADNDYIFVGDANVYGLGAREMTGLEALIDDGNLVGTIQNLSRSTYPKLKAQQIDASTAAEGSTLTEELLDRAATQAWERAGGKIDLILANRASQRAFWKSLKGDRVLNDPKGDFVGGKRSVKMLLGTSVVEIVAARKVPDSRCYILDTSTIKRYQIGEGKWDDTTGSIWDRVTNSTGRKDAYYAVFVKEMEMGVNNPARNVKITGLTAS